MNNEHKPQTNRTLHVCIYYPEHKEMAKKLYGTGRVEEQIQKTIEHCGQCRMSEDLLMYYSPPQYTLTPILTDIEQDIVFLDIRGERTPVAVANVEDSNKYQLTTAKAPIKDRDNNLVGVRNLILYTEIIMTDIDEFFKPPEGKRWNDML